LNDLMQRYGSIGDTLGATLPKRVLFAPASANAAPTLFAQRSEAVMAADLDAAITSQRLRLATRNATLRLMQIRGLQQAMQGRGDTVAKLVARVDTTDTRLRGLLASIDSTEAHLRASLVTQVRNVQGGPAYVLSVRADSLRQRGLIPGGLDVETLVAARTDSMLNAMPLFLLRDSVRTRLSLVRDQLADSHAQIQAADVLFAAAQTGQLHALVEDPRLPGGEVTGETALMAGAVALGHDGLVDRPAKGFVAGPAEDFFRLRIPAGDRAIAVDADDGVQRGFDDQAHLFFAGG
jgi:hypothetical protein